MDCKKLCSYLRPAKINQLKEELCPANDKVEREIVRVFGKDCKMALAISQAENGIRQCDRVSARNSNGTYDYGVFQINSIHSHLGDLTDCKDNIRVAKIIFDSSGWSAWSVYKNQSYKNFLALNK